MKIESYHVQLTPSKEQGDEFEAIKRERRALDLRENELLRGLSKHEDLKALHRLTGLYSSNVKVEMHDRNNVQATVNVRATTAPEPKPEKPSAPARSRAPTIPGVHLDGKTANLLLNSKLLSEEEKRRLLQAMLGELSANFIMGIGDLAKVRAAEEHLVPALEAIERGDDSDDQMQADIASAALAAYREAMQ